MLSENFSDMIMIFATVLLVGKGILTFFSKSPVGFGNDEKNLKASQLTDVKKWNQSHGMLWLGYAVCILVGFGIEYLMGDSIYAVIPFFIGVFAPIPVMMKLHKKFVTMYKK